MLMSLILAVPTLVLEYAAADLTLIFAVGTICKSTSPKLEKSKKNTNTSDE